MRKIRLIVDVLSLMITLSILSACAFRSAGDPTNFLPATTATNPTESIITEREQITPTTRSSTISWQAQITPITYSSIEDLLKASNLVIIGTVTKILPTIRVHSTACVPGKKGFGIQQDSLNVTSANVLIEQVIKPELSRSDENRHR